jgi:hypothetical protein
VVADDENLDVARHHGFDAVEMDNSDLGMRFNAGFRHAASQGADVIVHIGSDDWAHPDLFNILGEVDLNERPPMVWNTVWRHGPCAVSHRHISIANLCDGELQRCKVLGNYGCIPWLIPRAAMEPDGFAPIQAGLRRGIDGALARGMRARPNWIFQDTEYDWCVDFKSDLNVTPYRGLARNLGVGAPAGFDALRGTYPDWLVDMAIETCGVYA